MSDEKSLAVAYNIKRRNKSGEIKHGPQNSDDLPRKARLRAEMFEGGAVKDQAQEEELPEDFDLDSMFDAEPIEEPAEVSEVSPEQKRLDRLKGILADIDVNPRKK